MDYMLGFASNMAPVVPSSAWGTRLAPHLTADFFHGHSHPLGVIPTRSPVLEKEHGHVAVDRRNPVVGPKTKDRTNDDCLLVVRAVKGAAQAPPLLFLNESHVKVPRQENLPVHFETFFSS